MIFQIASQIDEISSDQINSENITVGIVAPNELQSFYNKLGFPPASVSECMNQTTKYRNYMEVYEGLSFGILNLLKVQDVFGERTRLGFFIKHNLFLIVSIDDKSQFAMYCFEEALERTHGAVITLEKIIYFFFERLFAGDSIALETMDYQISLLEDEIATKELDEHFYLELLNRRKVLLILRNYYEQLIDIGQALSENENDIFKEERLRYFKLFTDKMRRLSNNSQLMRDNLVQIREAYQALLDYNLNSNMKMFTLVTIVFLPLTLLVGWYGMNFTSMPELTWQYGYYFVIGLTVLVITTCFIIFKKKNLL